MHQTLIACCLTIQATALHCLFVFTMIGRKDRVFVLIMVDVGVTKTILEVWKNANLCVMVS